MTRAAAFAAALLLALPAAAQRDEDLPRLIVKDSLARFNGPCPYSYDRRRLDPWLKCYPRDVHGQDVRDYRDRMGYPSPYRRYR